MYAKFHVEILMGYDFTGGRISHFPIDFCMGLTTVQRKGAACDMLSLKNNFDKNPYEYKRFAAKGLLEELSNKPEN